MNVRTATLRSSSTSAPLLVARAGTTAENKTQLQQETDAGTRRMHAPAKHRRPPHIRTGPTPDLCPQPNAHRMQAAVCFWPPTPSPSPGRGPKRVEQYLSHQNAGGKGDSGPHGYRGREKGAPRRTMAVPAAHRGELGGCCGGQSHSGGDAGAKVGGCVLIDVRGGACTEDRADAACARAPCNSISKM